MIGFRLVLLAGAAAGILNAVAFDALPALVRFGLPPVAANAVCTGRPELARVYRHELTPLGHISAKALPVISAIGCGLGVGLLLVLPRIVIRRGGAAAARRRHSALTFGDYLARVLATQWAAPPV